MKQEDLKYIYKILSIILIVVFIDIVSGYVLKKAYQSCMSGICYQENYIMSKTNQDLLVFGSSRAAYHYVPSILHDSTNLSVYNCGREGSGIYYHYGVLLSTLKRYTPKVIFIDIDYRDIYQAEGIFGLDILEEHAPFYHEISTEFDSLLVLSGSKEKVKLQSSLYRYNPKAFKIITGHLSKGRDNINGFRSKKGVWKDNIQLLKVKELIVDQNKIRTIQKFIKKAKDNNIDLVFTVSPYYMITPKELYKPLEKIAKENNLKIFNHLQDATFIQDKTLFNDELHLNLKGATLYSSLIAGEAKSYLNHVKE